MSGLPPRTVTFLFADIESVDRRRVQEVARVPRYA